METCTDSFARLTAPLKHLQCDGNPFLTLTNPFDLQNWTLPIVELLLTAGAIACLVHAIRWYRQRRDSMNLVVWGSLVLALLLIEPITYFPQWFGLEAYMGLTFAHGQFTVQFLYNRLPLYIVAMYPVYGYVAFILVQRTGVLKKYNAFIGATSVATGFLVLFEVVDTVGPQWGWWIWNDQVPQSHPSMGPIPFTSIELFSIAVPFAIAFVTLLVSRKQPRTGRKIARDIVVVSVLVWPVMMASSMVPTLLDLVGLSLETARSVWLWTLIVGCLAITAYAFRGAYQARRSNPELAPAGVDHDHFGAVCVGVYLVFGVIFWAAALPDYLAAQNGFTDTGLRIGNLAFGGAAFLVAIAFTVAAYAGGTRSAAVPDAPESRVNVE
ncbi:MULTISPECIES: hypothetical protein [Mycobacterium]|uniref:Uncharacterized protein n=3 Tax=Mycobacterium TaxID=1763 RepID=A0A1B9DCE9_MYCMA|nr:MULTISPECIES: hypothetical protein [Mycobacterium]ETZ32557.1 putative membrane protein [Mycobacterium intracellulare MIN_052511_1280]AOS91791.1 hypothetical protein AN480_10585 [Mycobacterium intracellulare subsp. chimaera]ARV81887.1 hypothetical protein BWK49_11800 [Mycobacterium intracellulare subsp. chimaera]ASL14699.1 hypothetical protein MYCOZU2_02285 [Mycobacterium intracellulare subsp. chimaera]ASL20788.1 hypothetical protein MYCOZU1_02363 [Mycobacterium intracellulare subsp. chimaer